jgi:hypothetical protein
MRSVPLRYQQVICPLSECPRQSEETQTTRSAAGALGAGLHSILVFYLMMCCVCCVVHDSLNACSNLSSLPSHPRVIYFLRVCHHDQEMQGVE